MPAATPQSNKPVNENIEFLQAFLKDPAKVGSIKPSSPALARRMVAGVRPDENNVVIELGVGTGAITRYLQAKMSSDRSYLGIELNRELAEMMQRVYPQLEIVQGNAIHLSSLHADSGLGPVRYIVSCLPFVSLPGDVGEKILGEIDIFMSRGPCMFRTFQYAHGYYMPAAIKLRDFMRARYGPSKRSPLIVKNIPPAYTLTWRS